MKSIRSFRTVILSVFMTCAVCAGASRAAVTVDTSFTGTVILTFHDGNVTLLEAGDKIPPIPNDTTIEVFDGSLTVHTSDSDQVQVGCFGQNHSMGGGATASLTCGESTGTLKVDDQEYSLSAQPDEVPEPTAAVAPTGVPIDSAAVPDSRSIQASPQS